MPNRDSSPEQRSDQRGSRPAQRLGEYVALGALAAGTLAFGAVDAPVLFAVAMACLAGLLLVTTTSRTFSPGPFALALGVILLATAAHLVPLPQGLLTWLGPETRAVLSFVLPADRADAAHALSLDPPSTARELVRACGLFALALLIHHRSAASRRTRSRVLALVAVLSAVVCAIGLGHWVLGVDSLFGTWALRTDTPLPSPLANANHLAGVANLGGFIALGLALAAKGWRRQLAWGSATVVCLLAAWASNSRGGQIAVLFGLLVLGALRAFPVEEGDAPPDEPPRGFFDRRAPFVIASLLVFTPLAIIYSGVPLVRARELLPDAFLASKAEPLRLGIAIARAQPILGIGPGSFETAHTRFMSVPAVVTYTHAENELVQAFSDLGVVFGAVFALALLGAWFALLRMGRRSVVEAGAAAGAGALLLQNTVDFSLHFAAGFLLVLVLSRASRWSAKVVSFPRPVAIGFAALATVLALVGMLRSGTLADDDAALAQIAQDRSLPMDRVEEAAVRAFERHPADFFPADAVASRWLLEPEGARKALPWLNKLLFLAPTSGRAHLLLGEAMARLGRKSQALAEYSLASDLGADAMPAVLARFSSDEDLLAGAPRSNPVAILRAANLLAQRQLALGVRLAEETLDTTNGDGNLVDFLVRRLAHVGRADRGLELALARRNANPADGHAWHLLAIAQYDAGQRDPARATLAEGIRELKGDEELVITLAQVHSNEGRPDDALTVLLSLPVEASDAVRAEYHFLRGSALRAKGDLDGASTELHFALARRPDHLEAGLRLAEVHLALEHYAEAEGVLARFDGQEPRVAALRTAIAQHRDEVEAHRKALGIDLLTRP